MLYHLSRITENSKLGFMAASTSSNETCPDSCAFKKAGCYGLAGGIQFHWSKVSKGLRGDNFNDFLNKFKEFPKNFPFRYGQVGDLPGKNLNNDTKKLNSLVKACSHLKSWAYTHKPVLKGKAKQSILIKNRKAIKEANKNGFTINLSCDNLKEVDAAIKLKIAPVVVVLPMGTTGATMTKGGNKVIICPAQTTQTTCSKCQLCQKQRSVVVGFLPHGTGKNIVGRISALNV